MIDERVKFVAIVGPTATGKTDLALQLAQLFNGEVVCADSRMGFLLQPLKKVRRQTSCLQGVPALAVELVSEQPADKWVEIDTRRHLLRERGLCDRLLRTRQEQPRRSGSFEVALKRFERKQRKAIACCIQAGIRRQAALKMLQHAVCADVLDEAHQVYCAEAASRRLVRDRSA